MVATTATLFTDAVTSFSHAAGEMALAILIKCFANISLIIERRNEVAPAIYDRPRPRGWVAWEHECLSVT